MRKIRVLGLAVVAIIIVAAPTVFGVETDRIRAILSDRYILGDPPILKIDTHSGSTEIAKLFIPILGKSDGNSRIQTDPPVIRQTYTAYECRPDNDALTEHDLAEKINGLSAKNSFIAIFYFNCKNGCHVHSIRKKFVIYYRRGPSDFNLGTRF